MSLVAILFDNLQCYLRFGLKKCLLPQKFTVVIHLGEHERYMMTFVVPGLDCS